MHSSVVIYLFTYNRLLIKISIIIIILSCISVEKFINETLIQTEMLLRRVITQKKLSCHVSS